MDSLGILLMIIPRIVILLMACLMPIIVLLIARGLVSKEVISTKELMLYIGFFATIVFLIFVSVPYHIQGYKQIDDPLSLSKQLGLVKYGPIATFNFIYINLRMGFWYLFISLMLTIYGDVHTKKVSDSIKIVNALTISVCLYYLQNYQDKIGAALE